MVFGSPALMVKVFCFASRSGAVKVHGVVASAATIFTLMVEPGLSANMLHPALPPAGAPTSVTSAGFISSEAWTICASSGLDGSGGLTSKKVLFGLMQQGDWMLISMVWLPTESSNGVEFRSTPSTTTLAPGGLRRIRTFRALGATGWTVVVVLGPGVTAAVVLVGFGRAASTGAALTTAGALADAVALGWALGVSATMEGVALG